MTQSANAMGAVLPHATNETSCGGRRRGDGGVDRDAIREILERPRQTRGAVIAVLEELQAEFGFLPEAALRMLSERVGRPLAEIYGIATFYRAFSLTPKGEHVVCACLGTACHVRGAQAIVDELERQLDVKAGSTTASAEFTLETVNCLGACALGPVVVGDGRYFSKVSKAKVPELIESVRAGSSANDAGHERWFPVALSCPHCHRSLLDDSREIDGHASIRLTVSAEGRTQSFWLSSLYGSHLCQSEFEVPARAVVDVVCPHCQADLTDRWICPKCQAPMARLDVDGGGVARICRRRGCTSHMLDLA